MGFTFWGANDNELWNRKSWSEGHSPCKPAPFGSWHWKNCPHGKAVGSMVYLQNIRKKWHAVQRRRFRRSWFE